MEKISNPPWNLRDCAFLLAGLAAAGYGTGWVLRMGRIILSLKHQFLLIGLIQAIVVFSGLYYFIRVRYGKGAETLGLKKPGSGRALLSGLAGGFFLFLSIILVSYMVQLWVTTPPAPQPFARLIVEAKSPKDLILPFFLASFLAPAGEEAYFRGFLYPVLRSRWGLAPALLVNGAVFGLLHFDPIRFLPLVLGGAGLAYLYERTGSLLAPFVAHGVWNTLMLLLLYFSHELLAFSSQLLTFL
ncbi:MAG: protease family protein [Clostridia bacterium]|nr:protease family protein [Clostridia bacterium]